VHPAWVNSWNSFGLLFGGEPDAGIRERARPCPLAQARAHDGRRRDRGERTGQGLGVHSPSAGRRDTITARAVVPWIDAAAQRVKS
jgi:hypothetical protein